MLSLETQLHEKIDALTEQVAYWKAEAMGNATVDDCNTVAGLFGLTRAEAWIVSHLYALRGKTMSATRICDDIPGQQSTRLGERNLASVLVHRIRKALGADVIETVRGIGFRMTETGIALCDSTLKRTN